MKGFFSFFVAAFVFVTAGCEFGTKDVSYEGNDVDHRFSGVYPVPVPAGNLPSVYNILIVSDVHRGSWTKSGDAENALFTWLELHKNSADYPKFMISLGDNADHGFPSEFRDYKDFTDKIETLYGLKTLNVIGNHDLYNEAWDYWRVFCYPYVSTYCVSTPGFSFYFLDTGTGTLGNDQLEAITASMKADPKKKLVFMHYPPTINTFLFTLQNTIERNLLLSLFADTDVKGVFGGHLHKNDTASHRKFKEFCLSSFRYQEDFALLTVNEVSGDISWTLLH